jgi:dihydrofolate reductase
MRRIIVYIATSADGFIARPDGGVDWLNRPTAAGDYGMGAFRRSIDSLVLGRKTYEFGLQHGARFGANPKHYVFSRNATGLVVAAGVDVVTEQPAAFVKRLKAQKTGKNIWMMGGAALIGTFVDEGLIDEFIIHVIPTLIGEGIPLLAPRHREIELKLRSCKRFADGVVRLHYLLARSAEGQPSERNARSNRRPERTAGKRSRSAAGR